MYLIMRTAKKKPFSESRKYSKYKVTNWSKYNESLRKRGNIEFMIASDLRALSHLNIFRLEVILVDFFRYYAAINMQKFL